MQAWVQETEKIIVVVFEEHNAAGKGGKIKRFRKYLNPREALFLFFKKYTNGETGQTKP
ncbi:MAG: polyphosphate kinase 2 (PPK2 family) [Alteromonas macleodii]|jgi:polyphosphate kinase 2 (PPK2 family)